MEEVRTVLPLCCKHINILLKHFTPQQNQWLSARPEEATKACGL